MQGGGAHGAFTWGVLDTLLEDGRLSFEGISGTSAGAMNAVALLQGYSQGGADGAKKALAGMESGQILKVIATDAGSVRDFKAFCSQTGHALLEQKQVDDTFIHLLRRR